MAVALFEFSDQLYRASLPGKIAPIAPLRTAVPGHILQVYEDADGLARSVAPFLAGGLRSGEIVVVIATPPHWKAFEAWMHRNGVDTAAALDRRQLIVLDAEETLRNLYAGADLDRAKFQKLGDGLRSLLGRGFVRFYGEMVDLLWQQGRLDEALWLEARWNETLDAGRHHLVCAYHRSLMESGSADAFLKVSATHSHTVLT